MEKIPFFFFLKMGPIQHSITRKQKRLGQQKWIYPVTFVPVVYNQLPPGPGSASHCAVVVNTEAV